MPRYEIVTHFQIQIRESATAEWSTDGAAEGAHARPRLEDGLLLIGYIGTLNRFEDADAAKEALDRLWDVGAEWLRAAYRIVEVVDSVDADLIMHAHKAQLGPGQVIAIAQEWPSSLDLIAVLLSKLGRWAWDAAGPTARDAAGHWIEAGFQHPDQVQEWVAAKCTRPAAAQQLEAIGVFAAYAKDPYEGLGQTVASAVSEGLITPEAARTYLILRGGMRTDPAN